METQTWNSGDGNNRIIVGAGFADDDDDVKRIGDRLTTLTLAELALLGSYLHLIYGIPLLKVYF